MARELADEDGEGGDEVIEDAEPEIPLLPASAAYSALNLLVGLLVGCTFPPAARLAARPSYALRPAAVAHRSGGAAPQKPIWRQASNTAQMKSPNASGGGVCSVAWPVRGSASTHGMNWRKSNPWSRRNR